MKRALLALAAASVATPAMAQTVYDPATPTVYDPEPPIAPILYDPTGFRVEGRVALDRAVTSVDYFDGFDYFGEQDGDTGLGYGGEVGYDIAFGGGTVLGVYAGIEDSSTRTCSEAFGGDRACLRSGRNITLGARGGYQVGYNSLLYVKGGYSNGRSDLTYEDPLFPEDNFRLSDELNGLHVGAGGEIGLGPNVYAKLEYTFTAYNGYVLSDEFADVDLGFSRHQGVVGVGLRF